MKTTLVDLIPIVASIAAVIGVYLAYKTIKAQTLIKLLDEWRSKEVYESIVYVHRLRRDWKEREQWSKEQWSGLARRWVRRHANKRLDSSHRIERKLADEWMKRRTASQFLAKMAGLAMGHYLSWNDLFSVVPEVGRLLVVLDPIEREIRDYWQEHEEDPIADWDRPVGKWEFSKLSEKYLEWYEENRPMLEPPVLRLTNGPTPESERRYMKKCVSCDNWMPLASEICGACKARQPEKLGKG